MFDAFLVPEITVEGAGESQAIPLADAAGKTLLLTLAITEIVEQESLDLSVWGSPDGTEWGMKPLAAFPQKFYTGIYELLLDLNKHPEMRFMKAKWVANRWGVGHPTPRFRFLVKVQEYSPAAVAV